MKQINVGIIGTGWCGGIRAVTSAASPWVNELHIAEIKEETTRPLPGGVNLETIKQSIARAQSAGN